MVEKKSIDKKYIYLGIVVVIIVLLGLSFSGFSPLSAPGGKFTQGVSTEVTLSLKSGMNSISIPVSNAQVINRIGDGCSQSYNFYHYDSTAGQIMKTVDFAGSKPGVGYIVFASGDCMLTIKGETISPMSLGDASDGSFKAKLNHIGAPSEVITKEQMIGCEFGSFYYIDPITKQITATTTLEPTKGYFAFAKTDCRLNIQDTVPPVVPTNELATVSGTDIQVPQAVPSSDLGIEPTPLLPV
ncbi:MAG: hypothetical protein V1870_04270 [Candidatus Aenigmatarchaeota archaeon]